MLKMKKKKNNTNIILILKMVTNLIKFNSDPDLIYKMEESERLMKDEENYITDLMKQVIPSNAKGVVFGLQKMTKIAIFQHF